VALNTSDADVVIKGIEGRVLLGTDRSRDGSDTAGELILSPWEALIVGRS
jgi:hypothetical protein